MASGFDAPDWISPQHAFASSYELIPDSTMIKVVS
jgi:hypothetical protein